MVSYSEFPAGQHNFTFVDLQTENGPQHSTLSVGESNDRFTVVSFVEDDGQSGPGAQIRMGNRTEVIRLMESTGTQVASTGTAAPARTPSSNASNETPTRTRRVIPRRRITRRTNQAAPQSVPQSAGIQVATPGTIGYLPEATTNPIVNEPTATDSPPNFDSNPRTNPGSSNNGPSTPESLSNDGDGVDDDEIIISPGPSRRRFIN